LGKQAFQVGKNWRNECGWKVNQPVVTYEQLFRKVKECHERDGHFGRDKTWAK
ncbi:unnamed protein product, partial [Didymodactylos carnosus]